MGFTGGSDNRSRTDASQSTINVTNGGLALLARSKSTLVGGDYIRLARGSTYNVTNTVTGTNGKETSEIAGGLFGGGAAASTLPDTSGNFRLIAIGVGVLVLAAFFFLRRK